MIEAAEREGLLEAGWNDRRADLEPPARARHGGGASRLSLHLRHARQDEPGEDLDGFARHRGRDHADRRRSALAGELLLRFRPARRRIPGGFKPDQYSDPSNPEAHYATTGPELWTGAGGEVDAVVISVGTGGTITGVSRCSQGRKPEVRIVAVDPRARSSPPTPSIRRGRTSSRGSARECWPDTLDPEVVDEWVRVSGRDSFLMARRLARGGGASRRRLDRVNCMGRNPGRQEAGPRGSRPRGVPRSGRSYLSKFYDDNWMIQYGFLVRTTPPPAIRGVLRFRRVGHGFPTSSRSAPTRRWAQRST